MLRKETRKQLSTVSEDLMNLISGKPLYVMKNQTSLKEGQVLHLSKCFAAEKRLSQMQLG